MQRSLGGCGAMSGVCGGEYYISQLRWSRRKIHSPGAAAGVQAWRKAFCFWKYFWGGGAAKLRWTGARSAPVLRINEPKKTGAHSARARTRGQNPLVHNRIHVFHYILLFMMVSISCLCCNCVWGGRQVFLFWQLLEWYKTSHEGVGGGPEDNLLMYTSPTFNIF